jgi:heat shock protein HtpX
MNATPLSLLEERRHRWRNAIHTWLLASGSLLLLALTAFVFGGVAGVVTAITFGTVTIAVAQRVSPRLVLRMYKARPVTRAQFPIGIDLVEQIARRAKLPAVPQLHVVPSQMMNAFAVGRREDSALAITDALARRLTPRELAGVLAHEISHIAHEDLRVMAFADMVARYTSFMSTIGITLLFFNIIGFAGGYAAPIPWLGVLVLLLAPTIGGLLQLALSRTREFDADLGAAMLTGDPDGLASALRKLERIQGRIWESMMLPGGRNPDPSILRSHPSTEERVNRLMRLKGYPEEPVGDAPIGLSPAAGRPRLSRPPLVPQIGRGRARRRDEEVLHIARLLSAGGRPKAFDGMPSGDPASGNALFDPEGRPRIRISRGGVWW